MWPREGFLVIPPYQAVPLTFRSMRPSPTPLPVVLLSPRCPRGEGNVLRGDSELRTNDEQIANRTRQNRVKYRETNAI